MHAQVLIGLFGVSTLAFPTSNLPRATSWNPAADSEVNCTTTDKIISNTVGIPLDQVLQDACAAMMPPCAYPENVSSDTFCVETMSWQLKDAVSSVQAAPVENATNFNKMSGWGAEFSVTPASQAEGNIPVMWGTADCYGYFNHILMAHDTESPQGCYVQGSGAGIGYLTVGGSTSLKGTVFNVTFVKTST